MAIRVWRSAAVWLLAVGLLGGLAAGADEGEAKPEGKPTPAASGTTAPVVTDGELELDDKTIAYQATAGKLPLKDDAGKTLAEVFFISYTQKKSDPRNRPVTFAFNGGPGSSSVWLHMGMLGPRRIDFPDDARPLRPPYHTDPNPYSLLNVTDLVFIDPVSTGYSRPAEGQKKEQFHGYTEDVNSVGQFIHDYCTKYQRWPSAKFLMGESYGGIRAVALAGHLQERYNLELNGIVVVSGVINFQTLRFVGGNDLPYTTFLPTYTATAWYHERLDESLQSRPVAEVVAQSEKFAMGDYAAALLRGDRLPEKRRQAIAERLSELTGLSVNFVLRNQLRISQSRFSKELLRESEQTVGRFDSRYVGRDRDSAGESYEYDASGAAIFGPFTAVMNDYLRRELKFVDDRVYEILTGNVQPWSYRPFEGRYVDATDTLRRVITANPFLKVYIACGYYDLATPHLGMEYTIDHLMLPADLRKNIRISYFEGGHMMYIHEPSLEKLSSELRKFYVRSSRDERSEK